MENTIQLKSISGKVLFEYNAENNTVKKTLEEAIKQRINLCRLDLYGADLSGIFLNGDYFVDTNFEGADLSRSILKDVEIRDSNLKGVNLNYAHMINCKLSKHNVFCHATLNYINVLGLRSDDTDFSYANLDYACFRRSHLEHGNFSYVSLHFATLYEVSLRGSILTKANVYGTHFNRVYFDEANLNDIENLEVPMNLPEGEFIGWKKLEHGAIAKLKILEDSKRSRATDDKCRCDKALVLELQKLDGTKYPLNSLLNANYTPCTYTVGKIVYADLWDNNRWNTCSHGIHFFLDKQSAIDY